MKESIATRVGRIVSGGANKLIDMLENAAPEMVLEEALREIDEAIYDVKTELGKAVARKYLANLPQPEIHSKYGSILPFECSIINLQFLRNNSAAICTTAQAYFTDTLVNFILSNDRVTMEANGKRGRYVSVVVADW